MPSLQPGVDVNAVKLAETLTWSLQSPCYFATELYIPHRASSSTATDHDFCPHHYDPHLSSHQGGTTIFHGVPNPSCPAVASAPFTSLPQSPTSEQPASAQYTSRLHCKQAVSSLVTPSLVAPSTLDLHHNDPEAFMLKSSIDSSGRSVGWKPVRFPPNDLGVECCALNPDHRYRTDAAIPYRYLTGTKSSVPPSKSSVYEQRRDGILPFVRSVLGVLSVSNSPSTVVT